MIPGPPYSPAQPRTGAIIAVLPVPQRAQPVIPRPLQPPRRLHSGAQVRLHEHRPRVRLPWPAEVGGIRCVNEAVVDRDARVLVGVLAPLRRDRHLLLRQRPSRVDVAALQHGEPVPEDEVDGAVDVALAVELAEGVGVQGVLVALDAAPEEGRTVGVHSEGHRLVVLRPGCVTEGYVPGYEALPGNRCHGKAT